MWYFLQENLDEIKRQAEQTERSLKEEIKKLQFEKEQVIVLHRWLTSYCIDE